MKACDEGDGIVASLGMLNGEQMDTEFHMDGLNARIARHET